MCFSQIILGIKMAILKNIRFASQKKLTTSLLESFQRPVTRINEPVAK